MKRSTAEILREYGPFPGAERVKVSLMMARKFGLLPETS